MKRYPDNSRIDGECPVDTGHDPPRVRSVVHHVVDGDDLSCAEEIDAEQTETNPGQDVVGGRLLLGLTVSCRHQEKDERVDEDGPKIPVHCSSPCSDTFVCELLSLSQRRLLNVVTARKCLNIEHLLATTTFASKFKRTYNLYIIHLNEICVNTSVMVQ